VAAAGCSNVISQVECLRSVLASELLQLASEVLQFAYPLAYFPVVDGTYVISSEMFLNGSGLVAHVPLLMGNLRDEAASLLIYPDTTNVTEAIQNNDFDAAVYNKNSALFSTPSGPNTTLDVFNVTTHLGTDGSVRCIDQAIAYAGVVNQIFASVWYYEYERSYQLASFDTTSPVCDAPINTVHPFGDTSLPYFRQVGSHNLTGLDSALFIEYLIIFYRCHGATFTTLLGILLERVGHSVTKSTCHFHS
jgi:hypothetical protein